MDSKRNLPPKLCIFLWGTNSECLVMAMIGVRIAALGLALAVLCPSPQACAFGLRLGPFLFGVRAHHHHHYRYVVRRPTEALRRPTEAVRRPTEGLHPKATPTHDVAQNRAPSLLYPILAWPSLPMTFSGRLTIPPGRSATKVFLIKPSPNIPPSVSPTCAPASSGRAMPLYASGARSRRPPRKSRCYKNSAPPLRKPTAI